MPFNAAGVYTPPSGATDAAPGDIIRSSTWNDIFDDISTALSEVGNIVVQQKPGSLIYVTASVNFNSSNTDTEIPITLPTSFTRFLVSAARIFGASASLTTATCGLFTAAAAGGTAVVTSGSAITVSTASANTNNNAQSLTINNSGTLAYTLASIPSLFFRVQTPQGSAATGKVELVLVPLP